MQIGTKVKKRREEIGFTQMELAKKSGMTQARISEVESGKRQQMTFTNLRALARALGVSADFLIGTWDDLQEETPPSETAVPR